MKSNLLLSVLILITLITSCAGFYRSKSPDQYSYYNFQKNSKDHIWYYYEYNIIAQNKCAKYARKERRHHVSMISMKIENRSKVPMTITSENFSILAGGYPVHLLSTDEYFRSVKQGAGFYMFWAVYYPLLPIGVVNFVVAKTANVKLKKDIEKNQLMGQTIPAKDFVTGYVFMETPPTWDLKVDLKTP